MMLFLLNNYRVTLYAEFLPVRQRGKCVVLLDVIIANNFKLISQMKDLKKYISLLTELLGPGSMPGSVASLAHHADSRLEMVAGIFNSTRYLIHHRLPGNFYSHIN